MRLADLIGEELPAELAWILVEDFETVFPMSDGMREELEERFTYVIANYCHACQRVYCSCE